MRTASRSRRVPSRSGGSGLRLGAVDNLDNMPRNHSELKAVKLNSEWLRHYGSVPAAGPVKAQLDVTAAKAVDIPKRQVRIWDLWEEL